MTKKQKQAKKATKNSKRTKIAAQSDDEPDTANTFLQGEVPQAIATPESEVAAESEQAEALSAEAAGSETVPKTTRSYVAKANIKEGLKQHALAGRPTKEQLILVFGPKGYAMTWPQRAEKFGITPQKFQEALAEKMKETKV